MGKKKRRNGRKFEAQVAPTRPADVRPDRGPEPGPGKKRAAAVAVSLGVVALAVVLVLLFVVRRPGEVKSEGTASGQGLNVLLITLDTTRPDHLGSYGARGVGTPNLDRLAAEGVRFADAYCQVPLTLPSHASILTGEYPFRHGVHNNGNYALAADKTTLAEVLRDRGYDTAAFTASFSVDSRFGLDQGFAVYDDDFRTGSPFKPLNSERRADAVFSSFSSWLAGRTAGRFFAWVHFYDPHQPYDPPAEFGSKYADRPYDGEIAYMDKYVGEVVRLLDEKGLLADTLVVIAGDHGEAFGEKVEKGHGIFIYDNVLRVPLIMSCPKVLPAGLAPAGPVRLIDIVPTVLDILKLEAPAGWAIDGRSLLPLIKGRKDEPRDVFIESLYPRENWGWSELIGIISGGWKYIEAPRRELYDLAGDPAEERNMYDGDQARAREMKGRMEKALASAAGAVSGKRELTPAEQETLRSLGYVQFAGGSGGTYPDPKDRMDDLRLYQKAGEYEAAGNFAVSAGIYEELIGRYPKVADNYVNLALALARQMKFDPAVAALKKGIEAVPGSEVLLTRLGHTFLVMEKLPEAMEAMQQALAVNPRSMDALTVSALIYERWGRLDDAMTSLKKGLEVEPENEFLRLTLARELGMTGKLDEAIRAFADLVRDFPDEPLYSQNLGIAYGIKKDYDRAIENLEKSISLKPSPKSYLNIAQAYAAKGRYADAVQALDRFLAAPGRESAAAVKEAGAERERLRKLIR